MPVPVMDIGSVRMLMDQRGVAVFVTVRCSEVGTGRVFVLVMLIVVGVHVRVREGFVRVAMFVMLGDVHPNPERHERARRY